MPQEQPEFNLANEEEGFHVDVSGFEGPLDLLLTLARSFKVDLREISILALADQYLAFIEEVRKTRLELAADYLVMAAWLAFLKSRLLLPNLKKQEEPSGEDLAENLQKKLLRLQNIRDAAARLMTRPRLGRDIFGRGEVQPLNIVKTSDFQATLFDLLSSYASIRRKAEAEVQVIARKVVSLKEAREMLERLIGITLEWTPINAFLTQYLQDETIKTSVQASSFSAMLEMVKEGSIDLQQSENFADIYVRTRGNDAKII